MGIVEPLARDLYSVIWLNHYPKEIKVFFWELSLGAISTVGHLQCHMPYMLSLHRGVLCVRTMLNPLLICLCLILLLPISGILF